MKLTWILRLSNLFFWVSIFSSQNKSEGDFLLCYFEAALGFRSVFFRMLSDLYMKWLFQVQIIIRMPLCKSWFTLVVKDRESDHTTNNRQAGFWERKKSASWIWRLSFSVTRIWVRALWGWCVLAFFSAHNFSAVLPPAFLASFSFSVRNLFLKVSSVGFWAPLTKFSSQWWRVFSIHSSRSTFE